MYLRDVLEAKGIGFGNIGSGDIFYIKMLCVELCLPKYVDLLIPVP